MYYYVKNLQGDIVKIINKNGTVYATYTYDALGNVKNPYGDPLVSRLNPFRYRGYIYDEETGFYYLKSRYYDPVTSRFLNADEILFSRNTDDITNTNLFAYCGNNSVNCIDYYGFAKSKIKCLFTTLKYKYKILSNGIVQFYFDRGNDYWGALWRGKARTLAKKIYKKAKKKGKKRGKTYLYGRTIGGVDVELKLHWLAYKLNIASEHANPADIGGIDVDSTAWFFESVDALSIVSRFSISNISGMVDSIRRIKDYL